LEFEGFTLDHNTYQPLPKTPEGYYWSNELQLFLGIYENKLRYFNLSKQVVPTPDEAAQQIQIEAQQAQVKVQQAEVEAQQAQVKIQQAEAEAQQAQVKIQQAEAEAQQAQAEAQRLADKLRQLGIDPTEI
jgi:hypothetical protein